MLVKQFPDLDWLKTKIKENFSDRKAINNITLEHSGWPTIILNAKTQFTERTDIQGPFSIFLNKKGNSTVSIEGKNHLLNDSSYSLSNFDQHYNLLIDEVEPTETLNIHFGQHFYFQALTSLRHNHIGLLEDPERQDSNPENLSNSTSFRNSQFNSLVGNLLSSFEKQLPQLEQESHLYNLLEYTLVNSSKELKRLQAIEVKKDSTRQELAKRLLDAREYMHYNLATLITLDELSQVCCLSKFHFLRVFKEVFLCTPYQYIKNIRFEKAFSLIRKGPLPLDEIAGLVGIENASSLSRMVYQRTKHYPSYFRN